MVRGKYKTNKSVNIDYNNTMAKNRFWDKFSVRDIGTGKFYTAGSFTTRARRGLAGALRRAKSAGRHSYAKNLSTKDLGVFQELIGDEMSQLTTSSKGLGRKARLRIMGQAEKLRRQGKISGADKEDLRQIVKTLGADADRRKFPSGTMVDQEPFPQAARFITNDGLTREELPTDQPNNKENSRMAGGLAVGGIEKKPVTKNNDRQIENNNQPTEILKGKNNSRIDKITAKKEGINKTDSSQKSKKKIVELDIG